MADFKFPHIQEAITNFLYDEEGNIPRNKVLTIGAMVIVLGILMTDDVFAGHRSHSSHTSHSSHGSHSSGSGEHISHQSHVSHTSHVSSSSGGLGHSSGSTGGTAAHGDHANHVTHNNVAPPISQVGAIKTPVGAENEALEIANFGNILQTQNGLQMASSAVLPIQSAPDTPEID